MSPENTERERWRRFARERPRRISQPGPGQESVWDYPRPPRLQRESRRLRVEFAGVMLADTLRAWRVCETASPPTYYLPPDDVRTDLLGPSERSSFCEWKGSARYWTLRVGQRVAVDAAWSYPRPEPEFAAIRDHLAFYPGRLDACWVGEQRVEPQPGHFYGGWITPDVVGPFKGEPGSEAW